MESKLVNGLVEQIQAVHPDLRGGKCSPPGEHRFSRRQMVALAALCDTVVPSLEADGDDDGDQCDDIPPATKSRFFGTSASDAGIVPEVAAMMCSWITSDQFPLVYIALFLLSTRLGTLLLAGLYAFTWDFPFLHSFDELPLASRERILLCWTRSWSAQLQKLFKVIKCYTTFKFYSKADEKGRNQAWEAIDYNPPRPSSWQSPVPPRQLEARLVDAREPGLRNRLAELGCTTVDSVEHLYGMLHEPTVAEAASKRRTKCDFGIECDVVVAGSGCGGAVVAARLAEAGYRVVVLEKGGYFPPEQLSLLEGPSMAAMYEQSGALTTGDANVVLLTGTTLGGGSAVNWSACLRTPNHVRRDWSMLGVHRIAGDEYEQAMDAVSRRLGVQDKPPVPGESFQNAALRMGCTAMGYPVGYIARNAGEDHDCGSCGFGCPAAPSARKRSAVETWLTDATAAGAVIITGCKAEAFLLSANGGTARKPHAARGVYCALPECGNFFVTARVCVAACGALFTPPLLRGSGLRNPNLGRHLCVHPVSTVWGHFPRGNMPSGRSYEGGIMTAVSTIAANWDTTGYGCLLQTPSVHPGTFGVVSPWCGGRDHKRRMLRYSRTATVIVICRDRGRGTVREDGEGKLLIEYPLFSADKQNLAKGVAAALRALAAAGADVVGTNCVAGEMFYPRRSPSPGALDEFVDRICKAMFAGALSTPIMSAHQMGSCRMGSDQRSSAVDPDCETWEAEGLFVADSSVFPTASGVNPMITIQSVAYCTADSIARFLDQH